MAESPRDLFKKVQLYVVLKIPKSGSQLNIFCTRLDECIYIFKGNITILKISVRTIDQT